MLFMDNPSLQLQMAAHVWYGTNLAVWISLVISAETTNKQWSHIAKVYMEHFIYIFKTFSLEGLTVVGCFYIIQYT